LDGSYWELTVKSCFLYLGSLGVFIYYMSLPIGTLYGILGRFITENAQMTHTLAWSTTDTETPGIATNLLPGSTILSAGNRTESNRGFAKWKILNDKVFLI